MEDSHCRRKRLLKLERRFEQTRLENEFLACAYEHVIPIVRRRLALPRARTREDVPRINQKQRIALGGC
jgi:hypothetical protein